MGVGGGEGFRSGGEGGGVVKDAEREVSAKEVMDRVRGWGVGGGEVVMARLEF